MDNRIDKLKNMQTNLLIDVVKNYKQYGYPVELRESAIKILEERGIKQEILQLSGNLENNKFDNALDEYKKYNSNSIIAFAIYVISLFVFTNSPVFSIVLYLISLIFIAFSFLNIKKISQSIKDEDLDYSILFIAFSLIFYFFFFFIVRKQVKDKIMLIR
ncbi:hypothetical protein [Chryseobacterium oryctis]|uniref:DUF1700 domain-containing protein n=1 Tax=Chryseobacterium oryctis TaxID=2952618 RepID=A0ABT3HPG6_9FLAO|nr:hypothetical protein [Chryseobacterium oryctis]MCW3161518.1 hypothetical protein [Chryseobacterium oryctis]